MNVHTAGKALPTVPKYLAWIAASITAALGVAVLIGWHFHILKIIQVVSIQAPMQRITAWNFVFCSSVLILISIGWRRTAGIFAAIPLVASVLTILEYVFAADFGIDQLLGNVYVTAHTSNPGRMSPVTAICFLIASSSLLTASSQSWARRASAVLGIGGSVIGAVGAVGTFAYLIGQNEVYSWGHFTRVALHTSLGLIILGSGFIATAWQQKPEAEKLPHWLPLSIGLATAAGTFGLWQGLVAHEETMLAVLSRVILFSGILLALLLALAIYFAQRAWSRTLELRISQETFERLFEAAPDGIVASDSEGRIVQVNAATEQLFGYNRIELLGQPVEILVPDRYRHTHDGHRQGYQHDPRRRPMGAGVELYGRHKDGSEFPIDIMLSPLEGRQGKLVLSVVRDITQRKRAEAQLRLASEIITHMEQGVCLTRASDGIIVHANPKFEAMFGYGPGELAGKEVSSINAPTDISPEETARGIMGALQEHGMWAGEIRNRKKDGTTFWCAATTSTFDHTEFGTVWISIHKDITKRKNAEFELQTLTERLALATRIASIGVWEWDIRSNILIWDDTMYEMYGVDKATPLVYETWASALHVEDRSNAEDWLQRVIRSRTQEQQEFRIVRPDGSIRHIHAACQVILDDAQEAIRMIGLNSDITERKIMEAQLEANRAQIASSERLAALGMMAGGIAHEVNNPLAIIHASVSDLIEIAEEGEVSPTILMSSCNRIRDTVVRITKIIKSLRQISRDGSRDAFSMVSLSDLVNHALELCRERFRVHSVRLVIPVIDPELQIFCREVQIAQVLLNLLQNAFDAVLEQEGEKWIRLEVILRDSSVILSVIDSGPGPRRSPKTGHRGSPENRP